MTQIYLETDSMEYETLAEAAMLIKEVSGMTCEIGVRRGGGSQCIINSLIANQDLNRHHVCIDPYGEIDYPCGDTGHVNPSSGYDNQMKNDCMMNIWSYVRQLPINLHFFVLEDAEFFARFADGVPVYNKHKSMLDKYALVHFDGPHNANQILKEVEFFLPRVNPGSMFVFDDIQDYDHNKIENCLNSNNWRTVRKGFRKASYVWNP